MKYLALLRGINVGGNAIIKMDQLQKIFVKNGFTNVRTYIQSGNVIFESDSKDKQKLTSEIESFLLNAFKINIRIVIVSDKELEKVLDHVPHEWKKTDELRCYLAFVKEPTTTSEVLKEITLNEGIDFIQTGERVLYMSTKLSGITNSSFSKLSGKKIYQEITIRNYNTIQKLRDLMK